MKHFDKIHLKLSELRAEPLDRQDLFELFCRATVNSLTVQSPQGDEVGILLDLGVSMYDHSCRPNCSILFDGYYVLLRPLTADVDTDDVTKATISYTDVGRSRFQRQQELKAKWWVEKG